MYLTSKMKMIEKEKNIDFNFFYEEWRQRLLKKYNILSDPLKIELNAEFEKAFNQ